MKLSTEQTDWKKLIFHIIFFFISFHNRKSWKYTDENKNERNLSGAERALFHWVFLIGWGLCLLPLALLFVLIWIKLWRDLAVQVILSQSYLCYYYYLASMLFLGITSNLSSGSIPVLTKKSNDCNRVFCGWSSMTHNRGLEKMFAKSCPQAHLHLVFSNFEY